MHLDDNAVEMRDWLFRRVLAAGGVCGILYFFAKNGTDAEELWIFLLHLCVAGMENRDEGNVSKLK